MGKRIISQRRGKGSTSYRFPGHRSKGRSRMAPIGQEKSKVVDIIHNQAHTAPMAVVRAEGGKFMIPAVEGLYAGQELGQRPGTGNILRLKDMPDGSNICNIELRPGDGGKIVRSSGTFARLVSKEGTKVVIRLPSGAFKTLSYDCRAVFGTVAGGGRQEKPLIKAGNAYHKYKARNKLWPRTSSIHMNAVDHPFGGGRHPHTGKSETSSRNAPPGRKVGYIAASRTGRK